MMLSAHTSPQPKRHLDRFSRVCTDDRGVSLYFIMVCLFSHKIAASHVGIWTSFNTWFIGHTRVRNANGNLIVSAVFAGLTHWQSDRKTDRPRYSVRCGAIMRLCVCVCVCVCARLCVIRQSGNRLTLMLYLVPVSHLQTCMQGRINIIISLNRKSI